MPCAVKIEHSRLFRWNVERMKQLPASECMTR